MTITDIMQKKLDELLLPDGVLSHHIRRVKVDTIKGSAVPVNNDEYVVYRLVSTRDGAYGDGNAQLTWQYVDVNYYYSYDKTDERYKDAERRIKAIKKVFKTDPRFRLSNGEHDLPETDNGYRGVGVEFLYIGVTDSG